MKAASLSLVTVAVVAIVELALGTNYFTGIVASNAIGGRSTYTCRTQQQWQTVVDGASRAGFRSIRITGFDCNGLDYLAAAAAPVGMTVLAGIYVSGSVASGEASINKDVETFKAAYKKYGKDRFIGLTIGNEVNDSAANILTKVVSIRDGFHPAGITTQVSTVHTWNNISGNEIFCQSDFISANAHAFYDGGVTAVKTGDFVIKTVVPALTATCPGKKIIISESGWPSRGPVNGAAIPSRTNEGESLLNLNCASSTEPLISVFAFEYDDQTWKLNENERSFGIFGSIDFSTSVLGSC